MNTRTRLRWLCILAALPLIAGLFAVTGLFAAPQQATATPTPRRCAGTRKAIAPQLAALLLAIAGV